VIELAAECQYLEVNWVKVTSERLGKVRERLAQESLDGFLVTNYANWRYLSGFQGHSGSLLITGTDALLFTDSRYAEQAEKEAPEFSVVRTSPDDDALKKTVKQKGLGRLGFEKDYITYSNWEKLRDRLEGVELVGLSGVVEKLRMIKTPEEISKIAKAQEIADQAFGLLTGAIRVGATELELATEFDFTMRKMGSEEVAFPLIVVSGERSSLPHGVPTNKPLEDGDFVTFDFGATYDGYRSDETRTFVMGHLDARHDEIYNVVLKAQMAAVDKVGPGVPAREIDLTGRRIIEDAGYGEYFGHGIGHGVGLNVHEGPSVARKSEDILAPGMVITVEPGIYIPGFGGVRIEDLVLVTEDGHRVLSASPKELTVLDPR
jgi:Xaa-Pro aminopeptidase